MCQRAKGRHPHCQAGQLRLREIHGNHARGTNIIPFSVHNIDETLNDIGINVTMLTRAKQWLFPVNPSDYRGVVQTLKKRIHG